MRILVGLLVVLLIWMQWQLWHELAQVRTLNARLAEQLDTNTRLQDRNDALFAEVQDLREGLEAIEERARTELGLVGEGESFFLIVDPEAVGDSVEGLASPSSPSTSDEADQEGQPSQPEPTPQP